MMVPTIFLGTAFGKIREISLFLFGDWEIILIADFAVVEIISNLE